MTSKVKESGRKSLSSWLTCEICQSILSQKDLTIHHTNCPPNFEIWNHDFIYNNVLYSTVETYNSLEQPKNIHEREFDDMIFISQSALQLCEIAIGDSVLVTVGENKVVKTAWPTKDKSLTSVSITKHAIELNNLRGLVKIQKLDCLINGAKEFIICNVGKHTLPEVINSVYLFMARD